MSLRTELSALRTAFSFFTRVPVKAPDFRPAEAVTYLPLVGVFLGGINLLLWRFLSPRFGPDLTAFLILLTQYFLANYFHFDGMLDTLDALFAGGPREKRLRILKTPEIGALGLLFGVLFLLGEWLALKEALAASLSVVVLVKPLFGRLGLLAGMVLGTPAKKEGLGVLFFSTGAKRRALPVFLLLFFLLFWFFPGESLGVLVFLWGLCLYFRRVFGGLTGDLLGALNEMAEFLFLWVVIL